MKVKDMVEVKDLLQKITDEFGVEVVEVEFKQGKNPSMTVFIDKEEGIDLDTCEKVHRAIDEPLDEIDPTYGVPYTLNVSSLGLDRPFKTDRDFERNIGKEVEVKLYASVMGKKMHEGELVYFDQDIIRVKVDSKTTLTLERKAIAKINKGIKF